MGIRDILKKVVKGGANKKAMPITNENSASEKSNIKAMATGMRWTGDKFWLSFGLTKDYQIDYWTLRKRSMQLFTENPYAKSIVRTIINHEIFSGIRVNSNPIGSVLWPNETEEKQVDNSVKFGEILTQEFELYANNPDLFDFQKQFTLGEFQELFRQESLLCGDGIIVSRIDEKTGLPSWQWINGNHIGGNAGGVKAGNSVKYGVEVDKEGRHVAYHVRCVKNGEFVVERIPCFGEKTGRRISWMVYGSERRSDDIRGEPLLSVCLSALKDLDRYKDAELKAAEVNANLAIAVHTTNDSMGGSDSFGLAQNSEIEKFKMQKEGCAERPARPPVTFVEPGTVLDSLAPGETVDSFKTDRPNVNFGTFKNDVLSDIFVALEIPPAVAKRDFEGSYNASRNALNMFQMYIDRRVQKNAKDFLQAIFEEFVIQSVLTRRIKLPNFLKDCVFCDDYRKKAAWFSATWSGLKLPAVDPLKTAKAIAEGLNNYTITNEDACRESCGKSFDEVIAIRKKENDKLQKFGLVPGWLEDNNGNPAYVSSSQTAESDSR